MLGSYSPANVVAFFILVVIALIVDMCAHRRDKLVSLKSAAWRSLFWVALAFGVYIAYTHDENDASLYMTGYLLEKALSMDNLFVIMAIFANFGIPDQLQHRVLYFGIPGALAFRLIFVTLGASLLAAFGTWALPALGLFVLWSAWKMGQTMAGRRRDIADYADHWSVRAARRIMPVHGQLDGHNFLTTVDGRRMATPLLLCLIAIELADVTFAFASVPAIFAVTQEPFLVYTSSIFAILGLRSLHFLLAAARKRLCHLDKAVVAILAFLGVKMLIDVAGPVHVPPLLNLAAVLVLLAAGVVASLLRPDRRS